MVIPFRSASPSRARRRTSTLALVMVGSLALAGCGSDAPDAAEEPSATPASTPSASATSTPSPAPTGEPGRSFADTTPVYFAIETRAGLRLAREPRASGVDGITAVEAMIGGSDDPDYATSWNPETQVLSIGESEGVVNVDLSAQARDAEVDAEAAEMMAQQLVWTVTQLYGDDLSVQLLIDGKAATDMWGHVDWSDPIKRGAADDVRAFVGIDTPAEGERVTGALQVTGEAIAFEGNVIWRVLDEDGTEMEAGYATAEEGMTLSPYSFKVRLKRGVYTVEVSEDDASDGEGGAVLVDTRQVIVK